MTFWFIVAVAVMIAAYDFCAYHFHGRDATVTHVLRDLCQAHPILAFALGVCIGHVFWPE